METTVKPTRRVDAQELEVKVKNMYRAVAEAPEVTYHFEMGRKLAEKLGYPAQALARIPAEAIASFSGVGYYFDLARLQNGEVVVDLGSGSGMDSFFAANAVGASGEVCGVDMTSEQLFKANRLRETHGFEQIRFHKSYIEQLPFENEEADVVISNGVINLSIYKNKVFQEAARVLKPGGRLAIADIVSSVELPESISCNATLWASCIGGAIPKDKYLALIEEAGFVVKEVKTNPYAFISESAKGATADYGIKSISLLAVKA